MTEPELPLEASPVILQKLCDLLPDVVNVKERSITCPHVFSLAKAFISEALAKGYVIDRTNEDGPLREWDGWIVIHSPEKRFIQTSWKVRQD